MKRTLVLALSLVVLATAGLAVWAKSPKDEWAAPDQFKPYLEMAAAKDVPVAVIYQFGDTSCPIHNSRVSTYETLRELNGMLKVRIYCEKPVAGLEDLVRGVFCRMLPVLFISDGEGHLIGYAAEETQLPDLRETAKQAAAVMAWKKKTRATLVALEKQIEAKQLVPARKQVDLIAKQDLAATQAIQASIEKASKLAKATFDKSSTAKDAPNDVLPVSVGMFFTKQTADLSAKVDALLTEKLTEIEALVTAGDTRKAKGDLAPLLQTKFGEDGDAKVKALDEKIKAAIKEAASAKKDAEEKPAGEAAN